MSEHFNDFLRKIGASAMSAYAETPEPDDLESRLQRLEGQFDFSDIDEIELPEDDDTEMVEEDDSAGETE